MSYNGYPGGFGGFTPNYGTLPTGNLNQFPGGFIPLPGHGQQQPQGQPGICPLGFVCHQSQPQQQFGGMGGGYNPYDGNTYINFNGGVCPGAGCPGC